MLLPRPGDAVKAWLFPFGFALGALAEGTDEQTVLRGILIWLILEALVYQARYQWNDIRGFTADNQHPGARARGRLPHGSAFGVPSPTLSGAVAVLRIGAAFLVAVLLPSLDLLAVVSLLAAGVFAIAVPYELLRTRATGRSAQVPPPLSGAVLGLWVLAGAGYALRGVSGLALGLGDAASPAIVASAAVAIWSFGVAFVTSRWAIEALAFARAHGDHLEWSVQPGQAREHSIALVRWLPALPAVKLPSRESTAELDPAKWRALAGRTAPSAPWNLAAQTTGLFAGITGILLTGVPAAEDVILAGAVGAAATAGVLGARRLRAVAWLALSVLGLVACSVLVQSGLPVLPWSALIGAYLLFTAQTLGSIGRPLEPLLAAFDGRQSPPSPSMGSEREIPSLSASVGGGPP
jgi:hypothetical protein